MVDVWEDTRVRDLTIRMVLPMTPVPVRCDLQPRSFRDEHYTCQLVNGLSSNHLQSIVSIADVCCCARFVKVESSRYVMICLDSCFRIRSRCWLILYHLKISDIF